MDYIDKYRSAERQLNTAQRTIKELKEEIFRLKGTPIDQPANDALYDAEPTPEQLGLALKVRCLRDEHTPNTQRWRSTRAPLF